MHAGIDLCILAEYSVVCAVSVGAVEHSRIYCCTSGLIERFPPPFVVVIVTPLSRQHTHSHTHRTRIICPVARRRNVGVIGTLHVYTRTCGGCSRLVDCGRLCLCACARPHGYTYTLTHVSYHPITATTAAAAAFSHATRRGPRNIIVFTIHSAVLVV